MIRSIRPNCRISLYSFSWVTTMEPSPPANRQMSSTVRTIFLMVFIITFPPIFPDPGAAPPGLFGIPLAAPPQKAARLALY